MVEQNLKLYFLLSLSPFCLTNWLQNILSLGQVGKAHPRQLSQLSLILKKLFDHSQLILIDF